MVDQGKMVQSSGFIRTHQNGGVFEVVLCRPEKLNAINSQMLGELGELVKKFDVDDSLRVMPLRAEGRYFCAGADISEPGLMEFQGKTRNVRKHFRRRFHPLEILFETVEKPVVVAHQGPALGGGLEMSLSCDFRLAAASAHYALPESSLGVMPSSGGDGRLTRLIGPHWARLLVMTQRGSNAEKALNVGHVHVVWPDDEERVKEFCKEVVDQPPEMMAITKVAIELAADLGSDSARKVEQLAGGITQVGDERHRFFDRHREMQAAKKKQD